MHTKGGTTLLGQSPLEPTALQAPAGASIDRVGPYLQMAARILVAMPKSSGKKVNAARKRFRACMEYFRIADDAVDETAVMAFMLYRCARRPADPIIKELGDRVSPVTAAGDVDCLRRGVRVGGEPFAFLRDAVFHDKIAVFIKQIGGRARRKKTNKKGLLHKDVQKKVDRAAFVVNLEKTTKKNAIFSLAAINEARDAFALAVAYCCGLRGIELLALNAEDIVISVMGKDNHDVISVRLKNTKTVRSLFSTHEPVVVHSSAPVLLKAFDTFNTAAGFPKDGRGPLWRRSTGRTRDRLGRDWLNGVVKSAAPGTGVTPHSARVGFATELWAAGVPLQTIMAAGRWKSLVALLYVLNTVDEAITTSLRLGDGKVDRDALATDLLRFGAETTPPVMEEEDSSSDDDSSQDS